MSFGMWHFWFSGIDILDIQWSYMAIILQWMGSMSEKTGYDGAADVIVSAVCGDRQEPVSSERSLSVLETKENLPASSSGLSLPQYVFDAKKTKASQFFNMYANGSRGMMSLRDRRDFLCRFKNIDQESVNFFSITDAIIAEIRRGNIINDPTLIFSIKLTRRASDTNAVLIWCQQIIRMLEASVKRRHEKGVSGIICDRFIIDISDPNGFYAGAGKDGPDADTYADLVDIRKEMENSNAVNIHIEKLAGLRLLRGYMIPVTAISGDVTIRGLVAQQLFHFPSTVSDLVSRDDFDHSVTYNIPDDAKFTTEKLHGDESAYIIRPPKHS